MAASRGSTGYFSLGPAGSGRADDDDDDYDERVSLASSGGAGERPATLQAQQSDAAPLAAATTTTTTGVAATPSLDELVRANLHRDSAADLDGRAAAVGAVAALSQPPQKAEDGDGGGGDDGDRRGGDAKRAQQRRRCDRAGLRRWWSWVRRHGVLLGTVVGAMLGLLIGALVGQANPSATAILLIKLPGAIFMRMLKLLVVPLLVSSVITGVSMLRGAGGGRVAGRVFGLYLVTTVLAALLGVCMVSIIKPGVGSSGAAPGGTITRNTTATEAMVSLVYAIVPDNVVMAAAKMDMLGLISFSIAFGAATLSSGEPGDRILAWISDFNVIIMKMILWVIYLTPIGVCSLLAGRLAESPDFWGFLQALGVYVATVVSGLAIHALVILPLMYWVCARRNPYRYMLQLSQPLLTAFATASSSATLPVTLRACIEAGIPEALAKFGISSGATINMNGTALYEAVAALFVANYYGIALTGGQTAIVVLIAILAAIGAAGIPEAGVVFLASILIATDLPVEGVALLLPIDWALDRLRTSVNVLGDCMVVGAVNGMEQRRTARVTSTPTIARGPDASVGGDTEVLSMVALDEPVAV